MGLAAHQFVDAAGRCPCLSAPDPRSARRALAAPSKDPGPRSRPSSWKGLGFRYGASVPALREPSIERVVLVAHSCFCHVTETLQPVEKPRLRFPKGTNSAILCGQVADDGEGPKTVDLPLGYPPPLGNRHPFPGNGDHFSGFHFPGEPRADSTQGLLHCLPIAGEHGAGLLYEDAP